MIKTTSEYTRQWQTSGKKRQHTYDINSNIDKNNNNDIIKKDNVINSNISINSAPNIKISGLTDEQNKKIKVVCEQLLTQVQRLSEKAEIAYHLDYETMEIISSSEGGFGDSKVTLREKINLL